MFLSILIRGRFLAFSLSAAPMLTLGGCFAGAKAPEVEASVPSVAENAIPSTAFTPRTGGVTSTAVVARTRANANTSSVDFTVVSSGATTQTWANPDTDAFGASPGQIVTTSVETVAGTGQMKGVIESNGGELYRGSATGAGGDYIYYTNTPTKALNDSLGASALSYSYIGLGGLATRAAGSSGTMESHAMALFGGTQTAASDMPVSGKADYKGAFEGVEQDWRGGAAKVVTSRLAGAVNMTADFAAASVNGRVDYINRYTPTARGFDKRATDYSIGFKGQIIGNGFDGKSSLTQWGSDKAIESTTQTGILQGGFFGPKAAEATGALAVSSAHDATRTLVTGAFGAKKQ